MMPAEYCIRGAAREYLNSPANGGGGLVLLVSLAPSQRPVRRGNIITIRGLHPQVWGLS